MSKATKRRIIIAASLVLIGCIIFGGVMTVLKWDFTNLSTAKYETNNYRIQEDYKHISIVTDTADVTFIPSENEESSVICFEEQHVNHTVGVKDGVLIIEVADTRAWYEHINLFSRTPKITVSIPHGTYGALSIKSSTGDIEIPNEFQFEQMDIAGRTGNVTVRASAGDAVKIKTTTGNICVEDASAGSLRLSVSTGKITVSNVICRGDAHINVSTGKTLLTHVQCKNLTSEGDTGDISLNRVITAETLSIERNTGDVKFDNSDAAEIFIKTDTGDVTGSLRTDKVFIVHTDTGRVDVPKTATGGRCQISTDTGDIKITVG